MNCKVDMEANSSRNKEYSPVQGTGDGGEEGKKDMVHYQTYYTREAPKIKSAASAKEGHKEATNTIAVRFKDWQGGKEFSLVEGEWT